MNSYRITITLERIENNDTLSPIQEAYSDFHAKQSRAKAILHRIVTQFHIALKRLPADRPQPT